MEPHYSTPLQTELVHLVIEVMETRRDSHVEHDYNMPRLGFQYQ